MVLADRSCIHLSNRVKFHLWFHIGGKYPLGWVFFHQRKACPPAHPSVCPCLSASKDAGCFPVPGSVYQHVTASPECGCLSVCLLQGVLGIFLREPLLDWVKEEMLFDRRCAQRRRPCGKGDEAGHADAASSYLSEKAGLPVDGWMHGADRQTISLTNGHLKSCWQGQRNRRTNGISVARWRANGRGLVLTWRLGGVPGVCGAQEAGGRSPCGDCHW
jgi:hypothetical protein